MTNIDLSVVMAGLVPAIHDLLSELRKKDVDARHEAGHDERNIRLLDLRKRPHSPACPSQ
jgi:hypothetical protein